MAAAAVWNMVLVAGGVWLSVMANNTPYLPDTQPHGLIFTKTTYGIDGWIQKVIEARAAANSIYNKIQQDMDMSSQFRVISYFCSRSVSAQSLSLMPNKA